MSKNFLQTNEVISDQNLQERRKRVPSKYAEHIDDFKRNIHTFSKKYSNLQSSDPPNSQEPHEYHPKDTFLCKFSTGKQIQIKIVLQKNLKIKLKQNDLKKKTPKSVVQIEEKLKKPEDENNLLMTFLGAFEYLKKVDEEEKNGSNEQKKNENEAQQKLARKQSTYPKKQKDDDEKYNFMYSKLQSLNQKLEQFTQSFTLI